MIEVLETAESLRSIGLLRETSGSHAAAGGTGEGEFLRRVVGPICDDATSLLDVLRGNGAVS